MVVFETLIVNTTITELSVKSEKEGEMRKRKKEVMGE